MLNARLRKRWLAGALRVGVVGEQADLTYGYDYLGAGPQTLSGLSRQRNDFVKALKEAKAPAIIVGSGALVRADGPAVLKAAAGVANSFGLRWNVLHSAASRVDMVGVVTPTAFIALRVCDLVQPGLTATP